MKPRRPRALGLLGLVALTASCAPPRDAPPTPSERAIRARHHERDDVGDRTAAPGAFCVHPDERALRTGTSTALCVCAVQPGSNELRWSCSDGTAED